MKATILVDNTALSDRPFIAEHGFSVYVEAEGTRGHCSIRAPRMHSSGMPGGWKIDLLDLDYIVLSHGHNDHTGDSIT